MECKTHLCMEALRELTQGRKIRISDLREFHVLENLEDKSYTCLIRPQASKDSEKKFIEARK